MITGLYNAHDRVIKAMVKLQSEQPFFSYILMNFKITASEDVHIPTAGVDKRGNFYYNESFINGLDDKETQGLLVHEVMHMAKGDFFRRGMRDQTIWNIASDMVINYILNQEKFKLPKCGINPDHSGSVSVGGRIYNVANKTTEEVYDELEKNAEKITITINNGKSDGNAEAGEGGHGGFDVHISSEEDESQSESAKEESKWKKIIIEAATNARARGKIPGCVESIVDKILNPVVDWRVRLQKFITNEIPVDYTNRLPSRKFYGTGVWSPKILRENVDVFISVDVSGSTVGDRGYFFGEISGILSSYEQIKARLIFWDAEVNSENDHLITRNNKDNLSNIKIKDCDGGTKLGCYAEYCEKMGYKSRIHIILTDGFIESDPVLPDGNIIFVLTKNGSDEQLKERGAICRLSDIEED